jgi:hypothetical protein
MLRFVVTNIEKFIGLIRERERERERERDLER